MFTPRPIHIYLRIFSRTGTVTRIIKRDNAEISMHRETTSIASEIAKGRIENGRRLDSISYQSDADDLIGITDINR